MSDEQTPEHHTRQPGNSIPLSHSPEAEKWQLERPLPNTTAFLDRQFQMWCVPIYRDGIVATILAETSVDPAERPGRSALARRWEAHLAELANDDSLDEENLEDDPYEAHFLKAYELAANDPALTEVVKKLERLYKQRMAQMTLKQQYETPLPGVEFDRLMSLIFPSD